MNVATMGVRELRDGLSRHLARARAGEEIVVTDHGTPIARIVPIRDESPIEALVRDGLVTIPRGAPAESYPAPVTADGTVSDLLRETRSRY